MSDTSHPLYRGLRFYDGPDGKRRVERRKPLCDFCMDDNVEWGFACTDEEVDLYSEIAQKSDDDWAACDTCKELIVADRWLELAERSVAGQVAMETTDSMPHPELQLSLVGQFRALCMTLRVQADFRRVKKDEPPYREETR